MFGLLKFAVLVAVGVAVAGVLLGIAPSAGLVQFDTSDARSVVLDHVIGANLPSLSSAYERAADELERLSLAP